MTSPAICVHSGDSWHINNCEFYFLTDKKKMEVEMHQFTGTLMNQWTSQEERFYNNALWADEILQKHKPSHVTLEGYAMGAKGLVFHIGENTSVLKQMMWKSGIPFDVPPPTVIKKFATGKGNANKEKLQEAFIAETGLDLKKKLGQTELSWNPSSDLIDAYYMAKYGFHQTLK